MRLIRPGRLLALGATIAFVASACAGQGGTTAPSVGPSTAPTAAGSAAESSAPSAAAFDWKKYAGQRDHVPGQPASLDRRDDAAPRPVHRRRRASRSTCSPSPRTSTSTRWSRSCGPAPATADVYFLPMDSTALLAVQRGPDRAADALPQRPDQDGRRLRPQGLPAGLPRSGAPTRPVTPARSSTGSRSRSRPTSCSRTRTSSTSTSAGSCPSHVRRAHRRGRRRSPRTGAKDGVVGRGHARASAPTRSWTRSPASSSTRGARRTPRRRTASGSTAPGTSRG